MNKDQTVIFYLVVLGLIAALTIYDSLVNPAIKKRRADKRMKEILDDLSSKHKLP